MVICIFTNVVVDVFIVFGVINGSNLIIIINISTSALLPTTVQCVPFKETQATPKISLRSMMMMMMMI